VVEAVSPTPCADRRIDKVLGIEAGVCVRRSVGYRHAAGFVPVRKAGK